MLKGVTVYDPPAIRGSRTHMIYKLESLWRSDEKYKC